MTTSQTQHSPGGEPIGPRMPNGDFFRNVPHSQEGTPDVFGSTPLEAVADHLDRPTDPRAIDPLTQTVTHQPVEPSGLSYDDRWELENLRAEKDLRERQELDELRRKRDADTAHTTTATDPEKPQWYRNKGFLIGAGSLSGLALAAAVAVGMRSGDSEGKSTSRLPAATETIGDAGAIAVNGNQFPEKANKTFDDLFGIYDGVGPDGQLKDRAKLAKKWGLGPLKIDKKEAAALTTPYKEIVGTQNFDLLTIQSNALDRAISQIEIAANAINMNNDVAKYNRLQKIQDKEKAALYDNAKLSEQILQVAYDSESPIDGNTFVALLANSANNAGLRAKISRINTPSDTTFAGAGPEGTNLRSLFRDKGDVREFPTDGSRGLVGTLTINIAWVNPAGEIDHISTLPLEVMLLPTKGNSELLLSDVYPRTS